MRKLDPGQGKMHKPIAVLLTAGLILSGCSGWKTSGFNPKNWFGNSQPASAGDANPLMPPQRSGLLSRPEAEDLSVPIARITELRVEPTTTGAIIYAKGVATRQGPYATSLRPVSTPEQIADGLLVLSFRVTYPAQPTPVGNERSRTVHEAHYISKQDASRIRTIRVEARENALESRRR